MNTSLQTVPLPAVYSLEALARKLARLPGFVMLPLAPNKGHDQWLLAALPQNNYSLPPHQTGATPANTRGLLAGCLPYDWSQAEEACASEYLWWLEIPSQGNGNLVFAPKATLPFTPARTDIAQGFDEWLKTLAEAPDFYLTTLFNNTLSRSQYKESFQKIQEYLQAGDCYQVNYTQRFEARYQGGPIHAFLKLLNHSRPPFSGFFSYPSSGKPLPRRTVVSFSPEEFLTIDPTGTITTRPIKGTRPRGKTPEEDKQLRDDLNFSQKDRAENLMIVDLLRNDLGAICETGTVSVTELFKLESFSNVHHLVSTISGKLKTGITPLEALIRCFPGGSITGAPKKRAMEIIRELEPVRRQNYCGSLFWQRPGDTFYSSICIRTLVCEETDSTPGSGNIYCWGGGGIVNDSSCDAEYQESIEKVRYLLEGLEEFAET